MRPIPTIRFSIQSIVAAVAFSLALSTGAAASTSVGQLDPGGGIVCGASYFTQANEGSSPSYVITASGVVTSWSTRANDTPDRELGLRIFRSTPTPNQYVLVGGTAGSGFESLTHSVVNTFPVRVPVKAGDRLGLRLGNDAENGGANCVFATNASDAIVNGGPVPPEVNPGSTVTFFGPFDGYRVNVSALVEPDADLDGYGDETQDGCPSDPATQGACAPKALLLSELAITPGHFLPKTQSKQSSASRSTTGATISFTLSAAATVRFDLQRRSPGRKGKGSNCIKPKRGNRGRSHCARRYRDAGSFSLDGQAGRNSSSFDGTLSDKALRHGVYRATVVATNSNGSSQPTQLLFKITQK